MSKQLNLFSEEELKIEELAEEEVAMVCSILYKQKNGSR